MKREILFEYGFESVNGIIKKRYYLHEIPFLKEKRDVFNVLPIIYVRQFTGLTDKNGVKIFENDKTNYGTILFKYGCFGINSNHGFVEINNWNLSHIEIIGNIHE